MRQALLIPEPDTPAAWCERWEIPLLEEIPAPGLPTAKHFGGLPAWPGRNHPTMGAWLEKQHGGGNRLYADPFWGVGALWYNAGGHIQGCEIEADPLRGVQGDARYWRPRYRDCDLVMFSPPYLQNHDSGQGDAVAKSWQAIQAFGDHPCNLASFPPREFFIAMRQVYENVRTYTRDTGRMVVILRDMIRNGQGLDHVGRHIGQMKFAGWDIVGAHPRDLERPTCAMAIKVARDPETPWTRYEWAIVARKA